MIVIIFLLLFIFLVYFGSGIHTVPTSKIYVVERLGEYNRYYTAGLMFTLPFIDKIAYKLNAQTNYFNLEPFEVLTKDNVTKEVLIDKLGYIIDNVETYVYEHPEYKLDLIPIIIKITQEIFHNYNSNELIENSSQIENAIIEEINKATNDWGTSTTHIHYILNDAK